MKTRYQVQIWVNQLIGALLRFTKETIAFMNHIEKIYFQICVLGKHQNFQRFLWWKDGDFSKEPIDHEMSAHGFGGVSSGAMH